MASGFQSKVFLAGRVAVESDGRVIDEARFPGRQGRLLFAYLVAEEGRAVPRDELAEALWGESPPATWDKALTGIVSKLRALLVDSGLDGANALTGAFGCYRLDLPKGTWVDVIVAAEAVQEAEEALAADDLDDAESAAGLAESLVRQAFLPGEEGAWVEEKRRELADVRSRALDALADASLRSGNSPAAAKWAEELIALEPFRETGYRSLMAAHVAAGNRAEALRVYERCRRLLADELGTYPSPETESIYRELLVANSVELPEIVLETPPAASVNGQSRFTAPRLGRVAAVGGVVLLIAGVTATFFVLRSSSAPLTRAEPNSAAIIDAKSNRLVADVPMGAVPTRFAVGEGAVWATSEQERSVLRIDLDSKSVQRIPVDGAPGGIAVGAGDVWVADSLDGALMRIDPGTNRVVQTIPVGVTPDAVAFARGALWVTSADDRTLNEVDPVNGHVVKRIRTGAIGRGVAVGDGAVWVTDESSHSVMRVDPVSRRVTTIVPVGSGPTGIAFGAGAVWVADSLDGTVDRIDPETNTVTATTPVGGSPNGIVAHADAVWVSSEFSGSLVRLDPTTGDVRTRIPLRSQPKGLVVSSDQVWVAVQPSGVGHRGGRLVVVVPSPGGTNSIDPSFMNWAGMIRDLSAVYDGLIDNKHTGGSEGGQIVPNLATSLPVMTAGDTRYAFQLRRGIRYSNGTLVRASDFRRALERLFRGRSTGADAFSSLVGAVRCRQRPLQCDLSKGVRGDDVTGTIDFSLRRADPDFLGALIGLAPIPVGTPNHDLGTRSVPSTGPYLIESYVPQRRLTLARNPYFHVWSRLAQPDGFPDKIVIKFSRGERAGVAEVQRGQADLTFIGTLSEELEARYPSQVRLHPEQATVFLFLNTRRRPFDDVRVRRAVNLAVDRAAVARSEGAPQLARVTCQLRPPGTVGFRRYCPYTADPTRTGAWRAPDVARARRLVAASGTKGMKVTVWTAPHFWTAGARVAVSTLEELGYRARFRLARDLDTYIAKTGGRTTTGVQAGMMGYYGLPRAASSSITSLALTCGSIRQGPQNMNPSFFCNRLLDEQIAQAQKLQVTDPDAAVGVWARIENRLVDLAPWVPLITPWSGDFVSRRVGHYQYNPASGVLFVDQLWVR